MFVDIILDSFFGYAADTSGEMPRTSKCTISEHFLPEFEMQEKNLARRYAFQILHYSRNRHMALVNSNYYNLVIIVNEIFSKEQYKSLDVKDKVV